MKPGFGSNNYHRNEGKVCNVSTFSRYMVDGCGLWWQGCCKLQGFNEIIRLYCIVLTWSSLLFCHCIGY